jgi:hypothetical protein
LSRKFHLVTFGGCAPPRSGRYYLEVSKFVRTQEGCTGLEIAYFMKIYLSGAGPSWAQAMLEYVWLLLSGPFVGESFMDLIPS